MAGVVVVTATCSWFMGVVCACVVSTFVYCSSSGFVRFQSTKQESRRCWPLILSSLCDVVLVVLIVVHSQPVCVLLSIVRCRRCCTMMPVVSKVSADVLDGVAEHVRVIAEGEGPMAPLLVPLRLVPALVPKVPSCSCGRCGSGHFIVTTSLLLLLCVRFRSRVFLITKVGRDVVVLGPRSVFMGAVSFQSCLVDPPITACHHQSRV
mmetsp:Transcript_2480/g.7271  ORF Transcript_2480/g.7271 Transcript_2480/m.7271 type:complete len:207 (-) Transcript_2480:221-841(-)